MKKLISAAIVSRCLIASAFSAPKAPVLKPIDIDVVCEKGEYNDFVVDPRIEIIAIACRLAEMQGFTNVYGSGDELIGQTVTLYEKYKTHKAVNTIKTLIQNGIPNDAMISLAYHIKPDFSGTIIDFSPFPETLHYDWKKIIEHRNKNRKNTCNNQSGKRNFAIRRKICGQKASPCKRRTWKNRNKSANKSNQEKHACNNS